MRDSSSRTLVWAGILAFVAAILSGGCVSYTTLHRATPVEPGNYNFKVAGTYQSITGISVLEAGPSGEIHGRLGLTEHLDVGAKVSPFGLGFDVNYALINEPSYAFSIDPAVTGVSFPLQNRPNFTYGQGFVNVLADVVKTDRLSLTVGGKPGFAFARFPRTQGPFVTPLGGLLGGTVGATIKVVDHLGVQPWVDVLATTQGQPVVITGSLAIEVRL